jgi:glycosyltransferase involved in cell wall biosynthesis
MHQYTADLANRMVEKYDVHLITTNIYPRDRYSPGIKVHTPVRLTNTGLSPESVRLDGLWRVRRQLREVKPDLVHITGPHLWNLNLVQWLKSQDVPVIHTIHDLDPHAGTRLAKLLYSWNRLITRWADHILVHGERYRQRLLDIGLDEGKVTCTPLLHLFFSYAYLEQVETVADQVVYEPFDLFFGRLEPYKGLETLLAAHRRLTESELTAGNRPTRLVLAGRSRLPNGWSSDLPAEVEVRDRFIGDEEALDLFRHCSLVVLPYTDATQSALVAAAFYFHKPVLATCSGALEEYVDDGHNGILVTPGDAQAMSQGISGLLYHKSQLKEMGDKGRKWYDRKRDQELKILIDLYESHCK